MGAETTIHRIIEESNTDHIVSLPDDDLSVVSLVPHWEAGDRFFTLETKDDTILYGMGYVGTFNHKDIRAVVIGTNINAISSLVNTLNNDYPTNVLSYSAGLTKEQREKGVIEVVAKDVKSLNETKALMIFV